VTIPGGDHLVFRTVGLPEVAEAPQPEAYRFEVWEPSLLQPLPSGVPRATYGTWWLFHQARVFRNASYGVVLVWKGDALAHRLGIFPGWFRFPFMARDDLQFGDLWTSPEHRGRGLASHALRVAMRARSEGGDRVFWYLTHEGNTASVRTAERAGFRRVGRAMRTRRWGIRQLGAFELTGT
jgi:RimJ/RimL family protein N-acetyltransferase